MEPWTRVANDQVWKRPVTLVTVGVIALAVGIWACGWIALRYDDSYNLWAARTLAFEGTYGTRLAGTVLPFDPAVTTGPTVLLPLALGLKVLGPTIESVRLLLALGFMLWMVLVATTLAALWGPRTAALSCTLLCLLPLFIPLGVAVMGEVPALALVLVGVFFLGLADRRSERRGAIVLSVAAGGAFGLAMLAKVIVVLAVASLAAVALVELAIPGKRAHGRRHIAAVVVAGVLALCWQLGVWGYIQRASPEIQATWQGVSQYDTARLLHGVAFGPSLAKHGDWYKALGMYAPALALVALAGATLALLARQDSRSDTSQAAVEPALLILGAMAGGCVGWFLLVAGPKADERHLLPGAALGLVFAVRVFVINRAAVVRLQQHSSSGISRVVLDAVVLLMSVMVGWHAAGGVNNLGDLRRDHLVRRAGQEAVATYLREHAMPGEGVAGWGWLVPWDVAFLADMTPGRIEPTSASLDGIEPWVAMSPELWHRRSEAHFRRLNEFLAALGSPAVADLGGYSLWRVTTPFEAIRSGSGPPRLRSINTNPIVAGQPVELWGGIVPPPDPRLGVFVMVRAIGSRLTAFTAVEIDGTVVPSIFVDRQTIEFLVPPEVYAKPGTRRVQLRSPDGVSEIVEWTKEADERER